MAELRCNVAVPDVDLGTDIFAFHDERGAAARIQVKSANASLNRRGGYSARFSIPMTQLRRPYEPELHYALAVRVGGAWTDYLILSRAILYDYVNSPDSGVAVETPELDLRVWFTRSAVRWRRVDLTRHRNEWQSLPPFFEEVVLSAEDLLKARRHARPQ